MPLVSERDRSAVYVYAWVGLGLLKWKRSVCAGLLGGKAVWGVQVQWTERIGEFYRDWIGLCRWVGGTLVLYSAELHVSLHTGTWAFPTPTKILLCIMIILQWRYIDTPPFSCLAPVCTILSISTFYTIYGSFLDFAYLLQNISNLTDRAAKTSAGVTQN